MKPQRIHCSYHKCLTVYYHRVMDFLFNRRLTDSRGYRHFNSSIDEFYEDGANYETASLNNRYVDLNRLNDCRVTRFIRDPRDLVVSGYFYHKRGAENWCNVTGVATRDWFAVNGVVPAGINGEHSYSSFLQSLDQEKGLLAELEFRRQHFESMMQWPEDNPHILLFRYEDILGNEHRVFEMIMDFYEFDDEEKRVGMELVERFSVKNQKGKTAHIRNPRPGQWQDFFTPALKDVFYGRYQEILDRYGYV